MRAAIVTFVLIAAVTTQLMAGCGEDGGGIYCCSYESRSTACGGSGWKPWKATNYQFNIDDYKEGWSPTRVCDKFTGSDTECGGSCCINVQYRGNNLAEGACPG